ncbi:MAG TPA: YggT family protein [Gemmatimonadaceae bacterium]|nr:YggT family protein [Gemmatimonadaceae bacterium]
MIDPVNSVVHALGSTLDFLRGVFFAAGAALTALCAIEWATRTNRMSAFSPVARATHRLLARPLKIVEHRVLRAGGNPVSAPWFMLIAFFVLGILVLSTLDFVRSQLAGLSYALDAGPRGVLRQVVQWAFYLMYAAILISVISSWLQLNPFGRIVRTARAITEPLLTPIRRVLPPVSAFDLSPLVLWLLLSWIVQPLLMRAL